MKKSIVTSLFSSFILFFTACSSHSQQDHPFPDEEVNIAENYNPEQKNNDDSDGNSSNEAKPIDVGVFDPNLGGGGFADAPYMKKAIHPTDSNWTRQSRFVGPENPVLQLRAELPGDTATNSYLVAPIVDEEGIIYFHVGDLWDHEIDGMYAMDENGRFVWTKTNFHEEYDILGNMTTPAAILDDQGRLFALTDSNTIMAFDKNTGEILASFQTDSNLGSDSFSTAMDEDGNVYFTHDALLVSISPTGERNWYVGETYEKRSSDQPDPYFSPSISKSGRIFVHGEENIFAFDVHENELWQADIPYSMYVSNFQIDEAENIYFAVGDKLYSYTGDGEERWVLEMKGNYFGGENGLALSGNGYIVGMFETGMYAVGFDGEIVWWASDLPYGYGAVVVDANGTIYYTADTYIYAVTPDGELKWEFEIEEAGELSHPVLGPEGRMYLLDWKGALYIIGEK